MKVLLAGAFGKLGSDILKELVKQNYEVVAADLKVTEGEGYTTRVIDVTSKESLKGICEGIDTVITTVGLTGTSATITNYDIDYQGNLNLLEEAKKSKVSKFIYISVIKADQAPDVPMLDAKAKLEEKLKESNIPYVIHRPTGYFYDIAKVFMPMIEKGEVSLLGKENYHANVVDTSDFAKFIVEHIDDYNTMYNVGGKETYTYEEIATMFFNAAGKEPVIKRAPVFLFDILIFINKLKKNGKDAIIKFSKWTLTSDLVGEDIAGDLSFKEYIKSRYKGE